MILEDMVVMTPKIRFDGSVSGLACSCVMMMSPDIIKLEHTKVHGSVSLGVSE